MLAGRMFRYFLNGHDDGINGIRKCKINILVYDYNGSNYEINLNQSRKEILPFDPMFLMENTQMNKLFPKGVDPAFLPCKSLSSLLQYENIISTFDFSLLPL